MIALENLTVMSKYLLNGALTMVGSTCFTFTVIYGNDFFHSNSYIRTWNFETSLFVFFCNEVVPAMRVHALNTSVIRADPPFHSCACNAFGA